jgi:hypothetical protein
MHYKWEIIGVCQSTGNPKYIWLLVPQGTKERVDLKLNKKIE